MRRVLSFPAFLAAAITATAFALSSWNNVPLGRIALEGDTWWHLAAGERILSTHTFPSFDQYSYTASGTPWIAYGWLSDVVMALAARIGGFRGIAAIVFLNAMVLFLLIYYYAWLRSGAPKAAAIASFAVAAVGGFFVSPRPQFQAAILLVLLLIFLERFLQGKRNSLWFFPAVFAVWVNTHGSFPIGLAVMALYWVAGLLNVKHKRIASSGWNPADAQRFAGTFLLCVLGLCITPYGTRLAAYPFEFSLFQQQVQQVNSEWQSLDVSEPYAKLFIAIMLIVVAVQVFRPFRYRLEDHIFVLCSAAYSCVHVRFFLVFAIAAVPVAALAVSPYITEYEAARDRHVLNAMFISAILVLIIVLFPTNELLRSTVADKFPEKALRHLQQSPSTHLFNYAHWGGYLIWAPGQTPQKVFIDGRLDLYAYSGVLSDYLAVAHLEPNAPLILRKYGVDTVLFPPHEPLTDYLRRSPDWERTYEDEVAVLFKRRPAMAK